jgi:hypothetical protein
VKTLKKKHKGPYVVVPLNGVFRIMDRGDGNIILSNEFNTKEAAQKWVVRKSRK